MKRTLCWSAWPELRQLDAHLDHVRKNLATGPNRNPRFDVVYHFVSPHRRARVRVKVRVNLDEPVPTLSELYPGAGWPERELYDLFGLVFDGHADLRRLLPLGMGI